MTRTIEELQESIDSAAERLEVLQDIVLNNYEIVYLAALEEHTTLSLAERNRAWLTYYGTHLKHVI